MTPSSTLLRDARPSRVAKAAGEFVCLLVGGSLVAGMLGLIEPYSEDFAALETSIYIQPPPGPSSEIDLAAGVHG